MKKQVPNAVRKAKESADLTLAEQKEIEKLSTKKYKLRRKQQQENDRMKDGIEEAAENGWF